MQAVTTPATAAGPAAPQVAPAGPPAPAGRAMVTVTNADGTTQTLPIPLSRQEVREIRGRREELSNQLTSAASRRRRLAADLRIAPEGQGRSGLEQRLIVLDRRIVQLETDIAATGRQLSAAPQGVFSGEGIQLGTDIPDNVVAIVGTFTVFVLFPIALAFARNMWKRGGRAPASIAQLPAETNQRLERLEQGVEAIAIEIERVAEGQRFVTKLLSEAQPAGNLPQAAMPAAESRAASGQ